VKGKISITANTTAIITVVAALLLAGCEALVPASEDPVLIKLEDMDRRLQAIERVVAESEPGQYVAAGQYPRAAC
jgi:hypothetical protein